MSTSAYTPADDRYTTPIAASKDWFRRCGNSGLHLPAISLGCWHNFGAPGTDAKHSSDEVTLHENCRQMLFESFDLGITHFDLANNYGPPPGSAEERVGRILKQDFARYRDELIISSKAGYRMWPGPYGDMGSRKYLTASLDASLKRLQLDYVDIFYTHRPDPHTPLEETLLALDLAVRQGKTLYTGISSYSGAQTAEVIRICQQHGWVMPIIHQPSYSMLNRWIEPDLLPITAKFGIGTIAFCPLDQGLLTGKYLAEIPEDSRVRQVQGFLRDDRITPQLRTKLNKLNDIAKARNQSLAQLALAWVLRPQSVRGGAVTTVTSALIGASRPSQIVENVKALEKLHIPDDQLKAIDAALTS
jgi:L-glyceraldehyde 3-phosphate reductase